jgi:8-oxo-dGTP diphosphatase
VYLEQLATFDALFRDPRGRTVGVAYLGLVAERPALAADAGWRPVADIARGSLPFDHDDVLATAVTRLRGKLRYTALARHLMPERFRVDHLRAAYESILGRRLNRSNFRAKLLKIGLIEQAGEAEAGARGGRPPHLYRFSPEPEGDGRDFL